MGYRTDATARASQAWHVDRGIEAKPPPKPPKPLKPVRPSSAQAAPSDEERRQMAEGVLAILHEHITQNKLRGSFLPDNQTGNHCNRRTGLYRCRFDLG